MINKRNLIVIIVLSCSIFAFFNIRAGIFNPESNKELNNTGSNKEQIDPLFEPLQYGKINDIEFGIGSTKDEILSKWGEPQESYDGFIGGELIKYDDINFFISEGKVTGVQYNGNAEAYGIKKGMDVEQVKEILGKPSSSYNSLYGELYINEPLILQYNVKSYAVKIEIDNKTNKVISIAVFQEEQ